MQRTGGHFTIFMATWLTSGHKLQSLDLTHLIRRHQKVTEKRLHVRRLGSLVVVALQIPLQRMVVSRTSGMQHKHCISLLS